MANARAGQSSPSFDGKKIFPTPDYRDEVVVELLSRKLENYTEVSYGTAHPDTTLFPNHRLTLQVELDEENVARYYAAHGIAPQSRHTTPASPTRATTSATRSIRAISLCAVRIMPPLPISPCSPV